MTDTTDTTMTTTDTVLDHVTDIAAVAAIGAIIVVAGIEPSTTTLGAITSIALGKRYLRKGST